MKSFLTHALSTGIVLIILYLFVYPELCDNTTDTSSTDTVTVYKSDTVYVEQKPVTIIKYVEKLRIDTVHVKDTVYITEVASIDTVFNEGELSVDYYIIPQYFDIAWNPYPQSIIVKTKYVYIPYKPKWYEKPAVSMAIGALFTGGVVWLVK